MYGCILFQFECGLRLISAQFLKKGQFKKIQSFILDNRWSPWNIYGSAYTENVPNLDFSFLTSPVRRQNCLSQNRHIYLL